MKNTFSERALVKLKVTAQGTPTPPTGLPPKKRNVEEEIKKVVAEYYKTLNISDRVKKLMSNANYDLYFGPYNEGEDIDNSGVIYPGFSKAVDEVSDALSDVGDLWIDLDSGSWTDREPDSHTLNEETGEYEENYLDQTYHLTRQDVLKYIAGKELASYL